jgi:hypothetical protein
MADPMLAGVAESTAPRTAQKAHELGERQTGTTHAKRGFAAMDLGSLPHLFNSFTLDDSSLALIALLAGMAGGWTLTNWRDQQLRTKKLKINRK